MVANARYEAQGNALILRESRLRGVARDCGVLHSIRYFSATFFDLPLPKPMRYAGVT